MNRLSQTLLALSLMYVVCACVVLLVAVPHHLKLIPFVLAFNAYLVGTLLADARYARASRGQEGKGGSDAE